MCEFPSHVSDYVAKVVKDMFEKKTGQPWKAVKLLNVRVKEQEYNDKGQTFISHNIVFEMYDRELKNIITINEDQYRRHRKKLIKQNNK